jgi:CDP-diacylglycerol--glycerol-3-phosphate 3-phosphatidyltransferase
MNLPNKLTVLRIVLVPLFLLLMCIPFPCHYLLAGLVFGAAALTDLFDGKIAREQGLITNLGKFLDPLADKMLTTTAFLAFLALGCMDVWALTLILTREFMVTSVRLIAAANGNVIAAAKLGKVKTVMQFVAILYTIAALEVHSWQRYSDFLVFPDGVYTVTAVLSVVLIWISVIFTVISGIQYVWNGREYFKD